jgi:hypothetical protein
MNDCENCNVKSVCEVQEMMNHYGFRCKMFTPYKPPTISECFRNMTDEKLAHFLWQVQTGLRKSSSEKAWFDWLHETYDVDETHLSDI